MQNFRGEVSWMTAWGTERRLENIINMDIWGPGCEDGSTFYSANHIHELYASRRWKTVESITISSESMKIMTDVLWGY
jgi:hypothetical protein